MQSIVAYNHYANARNRMFQPEFDYSVGRRRRALWENKPKNDSVTNSVTRLTCQENFNQYLVNTTLHGLRYVGDRSITLFER